MCELIGVRTEDIQDIDCRPQNVGKPMKRSKAIKYWLTQRLHGKSVAYADIRNRPAIRPQFRKFLADHFRPFNADLAKLLNRDLSHWV